MRFIAEAGRIVRRFTRHSATRAPGCRTATGGQDRARAEPEQHKIGHRVQPRHPRRVDDRRRGRRSPRRPPRRGRGPSGRPGEVAVPVRAAEGVEVEGAERNGGGDEGERRRGQAVAPRDPGAGRQEGERGEGDRSPEERDRGRALGERVPHRVDRRGGDDQRQGASGHQSRPAGAAGSRPRSGRLRGAPTRAQIARLPPPSRRYAAGSRRTFRQTTRPESSARSSAGRSRLGSSMVSPMPPSASTSRS